uniref:Solute carrier family 41 member n=1 Tax=Gouania willdenowi TaxID=441366 RepID=A0A8C5GXF8_GOUWI
FGGQWAQMSLGSWPSFKVGDTQKMEDNIAAPSQFPGNTEQQHTPATSHSHLNGSSTPVRSNGNLSSINKPRVYTERDYLLPSMLYRSSSLSRSSTEKDTNVPGPPSETICSMVLQILLPFLLAGLGTVSAGILLDFVQNWEVFLEVSEIFILVPAVLGMKGNLEMTLASRLSTAVNTGKMETTREKWTLIVGNLSLKQLQATVLGLLASLVAMLLGWMAEGTMPLNHIILLCSTSLFTAFITSLLQGILMVGVIMGSKRLGINPDNVATPMAASFGDLITLALLACSSQWFYCFMDTYPYVLYLVDLVLLCLIPLWINIASKHPATHILLRTGWEPVITAMVISSVGGLILEKTVSYPNLAGILPYAPVMNGIGGNLVSIQSSRISTNLHFTFSPGEVPVDRAGCFNPCRTFFGSGANHRSAKVLLFLVIPGQLIFILAIHLMKGAHTLPILCSNHHACPLQVSSLLLIADCLIHLLWRKQKDPDSYAIPYLTALGDLFGTSLLALAFLLLWCAGDSGIIQVRKKNNSKALRNDRTITQ